MSKKPVPAGLGLALMLAGFALLAGKTDIPQVWSASLWPVFLFLPAAGLHGLFFAGKAPVYVLIPGGMLASSSLFTLLYSRIGPQVLIYGWPLLISGISLGMLEVYLFSRPRRRKWLAAAAATGAVTLLLTAVNLMLHAGFLFFSLVLIVSGAAILVRRWKGW
ncbi:hypothetical protein [Paenibacillus gansuensis]|uniref:DUF5668 domain-containing protein n=1 Tax=Paenibacillus gansuensis TaxID=306542 RepID=A0ABW5PCD7_9BACL